MSGVIRWSTGARISTCARRKWGLHLGRDLAGGGSGEPAANGTRGRTGAARSLPIWVDGTVLACCNHAYEIAGAHRAGEVRSEHLLYALLRVEAAVENLEARGVRVAALRRECAAAITSEIAAVLTPGTMGPRRSEELEEVLRRAAALAYRHNSPAGVDQVLDALFEHAEAGGSPLLLRHSSRGVREVVEAATAGPVHLRAGGPPDARAPRRGEKRQRGLRCGRPGDARPLRARARAEIAGERKLVSGGIEDLQREVLAQREDVGRLAKAMHEKLQALEHLVATHRQGGLGPELIGRLQALEKLLLARAPASAPDLGPIEARLAALEKAVSDNAAEGARGWGEAAQKIAGLASDLATLPQAAPDLAAVTGRLDIIEEAVLSAAGEGASQLSDRLRAVEEAVAAQRAQTFESTAALVADIKAVSGAIANQQAHSERAQAGVNERVQSLTTVLERQRGEFGTRLAEPLLGRVDALAGRLREAGGELARNVATIGGRLAAIEGAVAERAQGYVKELTEMHEALVRLNGHQQALAGTLEGLAPGRRGCARGDGGGRRPHRGARARGGPVAVRAGGPGGPARGHASGDGGAPSPPQPLVVLAVRHRRLGGRELALAGGPHRSRPSRRDRRCTQVATGLGSSAGLEELAGVQDTLGVERAFDRPHQVELDRAPVARELGPLHAADAVLGGNRAVHVGNEVVHGARHRLPQRKERVAGHHRGLRDVVVHVAVAVVAERDGAGAGAERPDQLVGAGDEFRDARDRHGDVVLDAAALVLLNFRDRLAQRPQVCASASEAAMTASPTRPSSSASARISSIMAGARPSARRGDFDERVPGACNRHRNAHGRGMTGDELEGGAAHELEGGQLAARAFLRAPEEIAERLAAGQGGERGGALGDGSDELEDRRRDDAERALGARRRAA